MSELLSVETGTLASAVDGLDTVAIGQAGDDAKGEFHCAGCCYGIVISHVLPVCPMCGGELWARAEWRPFTRRDEPDSADAAADQSRAQSLELALSSSVAGVQKQPGRSRR